MSLITTEKQFEKWCLKKGIQIERIDTKDIEIRNKYLKKGAGKRPDFFCSKKGQNVVVEFKNVSYKEFDARQAKMRKEYEEQTGEPFVHLYDTNDAVWRSLYTHFREANKQFRNLKAEINCPRIVFISGLRTCPSFTIGCLFQSAYPHIYQDGTMKLIKEKRFGGFKKQAFFDISGKEITGVVCWEPKKASFIVTPNLENPYLNELQHVMDKIFNSK